jgi:hypothetical protein
MWVERGESNFGDWWWSFEIELRAISISPRTGKITRSFFRTSGKFGFLIKADALKDL